MADSDQQHGKKEAPNPSSKSKQATQSDQSKSTNPSKSIPESQSKVSDKSRQSTHDKSKSSKPNEPSSPTLAQRLRVPKDIRVHPSIAAAADIQFSPIPEGIDDENVNRPISQCAQYTQSI